MSPKAKLTQCIICQSLFLDQVDDQLSKGIPYKTIVLYLKDKGIELSNTSVGRHNNNHRLNDLKPKQIQKGNIQRAKTRAKGNTKKHATRTDLETKSNKRVVNNVTRTPPNREAAKEKASYMYYLRKMREDINVINELLELMAIQKDRLHRANEEEADTNLILATTTNVIKDYRQSLKDFHDITSGMESIKELRMAEMIQMIVGLLMRESISDQTRFELLTLMETFDTPAPPELPSPPDSNPEIVIEQSEPKEKTPNV